MVKVFETIGCTKCLLFYCEHVCYSTYKVYLAFHSNVESVFVAYVMASVTHEIDINCLKASKCSKSNDGMVWSIWTCTAKIAFMRMFVCFE